MKQDNNTTASIWWHNLPYSAKYDLSIQYFKMVPGTLNDEAIEEIHNGEHPEQPIKEDDEDKEIAELEEDLFNQTTGTPPIKEQSTFVIPTNMKDIIASYELGDMTKESKLEFLLPIAEEIIKLKEENQALRESNTRLKGALLKIDAIAYRYYGWKVADDIADIAKAALNNK